MVSEGRAEHDHFELCQQALYEDLAMEGPGWWSLSYFKHKHTLLDQNVVSDVLPLS